MSAKKRSSKGLNAVLNMQDNVVTANKLIDTKNEELKKKEEEIAKLKKEMLQNKNLSITPVVSNENIPDKLDALEKEIDYLKVEMQRSIWLIGQRLHKIREKELYKPKAKDFKEYCEKRFEFNRTSAYNFIYIFENYSHVHACEHGTKLRLLQPVKEEEKRKEILNWMDKEKPSFRQVEAKIKEIVPTEKKKSKSFEFQFDLFEDFENKSITIDCEDEQTYEKLLQKLKELLDKEKIKVNQKV